MLASTLILYLKSPTHMTYYETAFVIGYWHLRLLQTKSPSQYTYTLLLVDTLRNILKLV
jgi:hypothetical protein